MTIEDAMFEFYEGVPIQGPGSESTTIKLLNLIPNLDTIKYALDIGCGTGRTSLVLARFKVVDPNHTHNRFDLDLFR